MPCRISLLIRIAGTAVLTLTIITMSSLSALAGSPLATDDAATVDVGKFEIELNGSYAEDSEARAGVIRACRTTETELKVNTGLYKDLGISLALPYTHNQRVTEDDRLLGRSDGFGDITAELKYAFAELGGIRFAVKPAIILPTGKYSAGLSEGRWQFGGTLIASSTFDDGTYALHANLGYEHHSYRTAAIRESMRSNVWSGSIAGEAKIVEGLFAVADFGLMTTADRSTTKPSAYALTGIRYELNNHVDINAGFRLGLTRPETDLTALYGFVLKM